MPKYAEEILAAVTELQQHPTAEQVFLEMKREHPSIALAPCISERFGGGGSCCRITEHRYDRTERHDHLICSRCGKIAEYLPDIRARTLGSSPNLLQAGRQH